MTSPRRKWRLFGVGMLVLRTLLVGEFVWAQAEVSFIARRDFRVGVNPSSVAVGDFNGNGHLDLATANEVANTVSILINTTAVGVNALVTFVPLRATFRFTPEPTDCPTAFIGTFQFEARLTNVSVRTLAALVVQVAALSHGTLLQNADGGPGGVGARLTVSRQDDFINGRLSPEEFVDVPFIICLQERAPCQFFWMSLGAWTLVNEHKEPWERRMA
jgi:hypothetical protein